MAARQINKRILRLPFLKSPRHLRPACQNRRPILAFTRPADQMIPHASYMAQHVGPQQLRDRRVPAK